MSKHTLFRLRMPNFGGFISLWVCLTWPWTLDTNRRAKIYSQPNNHVVICCWNHLKHYHKFYKETSLKLPKKCNVCESNILQSTPHHMAWLNTYFFELLFFFLLRSKTLLQFWCKLLSNEKLNNTYDIWICNFHQVHNLLFTR